MTGRLMHAERVRETAGPRAPDGTQQTRERTRVTLLTDDGLKQFVLEESEGRAGSRSGPARAHRPGAGGAEAERAAKMRATSPFARPERATAPFESAMSPSRRFGRASYRLVMPLEEASAESKARLQGWATLENDPGTDWSGVSLTLQYGNPVTFCQAIYRSYFVERPEVPVEVLGRLLPDVDTSAVQSTGEADRAEGAPPPPPAPELAAPPTPFMAMPRMARKAAPAMAAPPDEVTPAEDAEETIFPLPQPVTLAAGHSASVPILDHKLPASRVSVGRQGDPHPRATIKVRNDTAQSLPAGVLTFYEAEGDASYAGDARLGGLPAGEDRLLSFAEDLRTSLQWRTGTTTTLTSMKVAGGVVTMRSRQRILTDATVKAPQHESRHILLEMPKTAGTVPPDFLRPIEETATQRRYAIDVKPAETRQVTLAVDDLQTTSVAVEDSADVIVDVLNNQLLSDRARRALSHILDLRSEQTVKTAERDRAEQTRRRNRKG